MLKQRVQVLNEAGRVLIAEFGGLFRNCVARSNSSAIALRDLMATHFTSYRDEAVYKGTPVCFYKRAQIIVADVWAAFEGRRRKSGE